MRNWLSARFGFPAPQRVLRFAEFELRPDAPALLRAGRRVKLQRQPLKLLALLAARRGALVTHDDIRALLWPGTLVDYARGTHVCIRHIRAALGDDAAHPRFVANLPGEGYRFLAPVREEPLQRRPAPAARPRAVAAAVAATALVAVVALWAGLVSERAPAREARDAHARGRYLLAQDDADAARRSLRYFGQAMAADSGYAGGWLGAAEAQLALGAWTEAADFARAALARDPGLAAAHVALGRAAAMGAWRWEEARGHYAAALALDEQLAPAHQGAAAVAALTGQLDVALRHMARAHALDPASTLIRADYGWMALVAGRPANAVRLCGEALDLEPGSLDARVCLMRALAAAGRHAEAVAHATAVMAQSGATAGEIGAVTAARDGAVVHFERWRLARYERPGRPDPVSPALLAAIHAYVGDYAQALDLLERSVAERAATTPFVALDPAFRPLAAEPRFRRVLARLGIVVQAG